MFAKPNDSNLITNGGYYHQADNQYGRNRYDNADSQYGRNGYDHEVDNQYDGNGFERIESQYGRYGYDHQADNQYVNGYNHADYQYNGHERNHRVDDQYGGLGVIKQIIKDIGSVETSVAMKDTIFMVMIAVNISGKIIRTTLTHRSQNRINYFEGMV